MVFGKGKLNVIKIVYFPVKPHEISIVSDDSDDEMLMRPLFERLAGDRHNSEITSEITLGVTSGITSEITVSDDAELPGVCGGGMAGGNLP